MNEHSPRTRRLLVAAITALVLLLLAEAAALRMVREPPEEPPLVVWPESTPEREGFNGDALEELADHLAERETKALLVARRGRIVLEWYAPDYDANRLHYAASMVKGTAAAPTLVAAVQRGRLSLEDPVADWVPEWADDPLRSSIRLRHLVIHASGLEDVEFDAGQAGNLSGWKQRYYDHPDERYSLAIDSAEVLFPPGTDYVYSGVGYYVLTYVVTKAIQKDPPRDIPSLLDEAVYAPIGIPSDAWSIGYGRFDVVDGLRLAHFGSGGRITARAAARIGQLFLQGGCWDGEQVLDRELVYTMLGRGSITPVSPGDASDTVQASPPGWWPTPTSAGGWWLDREGEWPPAARGAAAALGYGHQIVWIDPRHELVVARLGEDLTSRREPFDESLTRHFVVPLYDALALDGESTAPAERPDPSGNEARACTP